MLPEHFIHKVFNQNVMKILKELPDNNLDTIYL